MDAAVLWFIGIGGLLVVVALAATILERLPLTTALIYLAAGYAAGRWGTQTFDPLQHLGLLERLTEVAVVISLFTCGLKLRASFTWRDWHLPLRLASVSMVATLAGIAAAGVALLGLEWGHAVLLGAILAPTDPVLASDVQVRSAGDDDPLRFGLTGEAGLNDGTAFPFVMLGLGLIGQHQLGALGGRWLAIDLLWAVAGGLGIGFLLGTLVGRLILHLRTRHKEALGSDDLLALGLIALAYGAALAAHAYGFLAVFAAGAALRRMEASRSDEPPAEEIAEQARLGRSEEVQTHPVKGAASMAEAVLGFNEQFEKITELALMLVVGIMLARVELPPEALWLAPLLFLVIRPAAVYLGLIGAQVPARHALFTSWFGIRGIGSLYYLSYSANHGVDPAMAARLLALVLTIIALSVLLHGVTVTPAMRRYALRTQGAADAR